MRGSVFTQKSCGKDDTVVGNDERPNEELMTEDDSAGGVLVARRYEFTVKSALKDQVFFSCSVSSCFTS
jgi:hypothetical protein